MPRRLLASALAFALAASPALGLPAPVPASASAAFFNTREQPLAKPVENLLISNHYELRSDGTLWTPGGAEQVAAADLPALVARLKSSQRLKALLQLDLILSGSDGEKYLTPAEREQVRGVLRSNWPYFTLSTRKHFRSYFTLQELEELNRVPPDEDAEPAMLMRDPEPLPEPVAAPEPVKPVEPAPVQPVQRAQAAALASPASVAALPGMGGATVAAPAVSTRVQSPNASPAGPASQPSAAQPIPATPVAAQPVEAPPAPAAAAPAVAVAAAAEPAAVSAAAAAAAAALASIGKLTVLGAPPAAPGAAQAADVPAVAVAPGPPKPVVPPPLAPTAAPKLAAFVVAEPSAAKTIENGPFQRFLADAPYNRDVKALLSAVSDKAPEPLRSRALAFVMATIPPIYLDGERCGLEARAQVDVQEAADGERAVTIALNPTAVLATHKRMFLGSQTALLPDSAQAYSLLKLPGPLVEAAKRDAVASSEDKSDWGETRRYSDGSQRAAYSQLELAGTLFYALLQADAKRAGWDASPYAAEAAARQGQMMLYARAQLEAKTDAFLDPELRAMLRDWLRHPADFHDFLVHSLSAGRAGALDAARPDLAAQEQAAAEAYKACPDSVDADAARRAVAQDESVKKAALALARARLVEQSKFEEALKALDAASSSRKPAPVSLETCGRLWTRRASGLRQAKEVLGEAASSEHSVREELRKAEAQ